MKTLNLTDLMNKTTNKKNSGSSGKYFVYRQKKLQEIVGDLEMAIFVPLTVSEDGLLLNHLEYFIKHVLHHKIKYSTDSVTFTNRFSGHREVKAKYASLEFFQEILKDLNITFKYVTLENDKKTEYIFFNSTRGTTLLMY